MWQVQHPEHVLRGGRSTWSSFIEVRGSPATIDYFGRRLVLRGRCSTWSTSGLFCVAGAALGAPQARFAWRAGAALGVRAPPRFAWQGQHLEHLRLVLRGRCSTWSTFIEVCGSLATIDYFGRRLVLRGRCSTGSNQLRIASQFVECANRLFVLRFQAFC